MRWKIKLGLACLGLLALGFYLSLSPYQRTSLLSASSVTYEEPPADWPCKVSKEDTAKYQSWCQLLGCSGGFTINVTKRSPWKRGSYIYELELDGKKVACRGSLPLKPCDQSSMTCDGSGVSIAESGCAISSDEHEFGSVYLRYPKKVKLRVSYEEAVLAETEIAAHYEYWAPNGPGCGLGCCGGGASLELP